jgi:hypothetical protein
VVSKRIRKANIYMNKLKLAALGFLLSALYELKLASQLETPVRVVIFVVGSGIAVEFSSLLIAFIFGRSQWLRRILFARSWVEGVWYVQTLEPGNERPVAEGIATLRYVGDEMRPEIDIERPQDPNTKLPTLTRSRLADVSSDLILRNIFQYSIGNESHEGVAIGSFVIQDKPYPTFYDGRYLVFDKTAKRQIGYRIEPGEVKRFRKEHGSKWKVAYLQAKAEGKV